MTDSHGPRGPQGRDGVQGIAGPSGEPGIAGPVGETGPPATPTPLDELASLLRSQSRRWRIWFAFLLVVVGGFAVLGIQAARAGEERARIACETRQDFRTALIGLVEYVTVDDGGGIDFSKVPHFESFSEEQRMFFRVLAVGLNEKGDKGNVDLRKFTEGLLPPETCG